MPLRTSFRRIRRSANEADCPADAAGTAMRLRSMERIDVAVKRPSESGPIWTSSPAWMTPARTMPETTVPVCGTLNVSLTWNSKGASAL